jgi:hypothetical protein
MGLHRTDQGVGDFLAGDLYARPGDGSIRYDEQRRTDRRRHI